MESEDVSKSMTENDTEDDEPADEVAIMSSGEKLHHLGLAIKILDSHATFLEHVRSALSRAKREFFLSNTSITNAPEGYCYNC